MTQKPVANPEDFYKLLAQSKERLKELAAINQAIAITKEGKSIQDTLHQLCLILPDAWQYPEHTIVHIKYGQYEFQTSGFRVTPWCQKQEFETIDGDFGFIEVYYTREFPIEHEGPFLKEERDLIVNITNILSGYLNSIKGKDIIKEVRISPRRKPDGEAPASKQLLQRFINQHNLDRDIYHDLMPFKVKEILLISTLYDAYSIEKEDRLTDNILGEYSKLSLSSVPRITGVSNLDEALEKLDEKYFNMIIIMMGADTHTPLEMSKRIKSEYNYIPLYLLVNNSIIVNEMEKNPVAIASVDKVFVWNGDPKVFFTMIKLLEDRVNVENDTRIALTRVILLVEDSPKYYSRYLPLLYSSVLEQTKRIIEDVSTDDLYKVLRIRIRPKIILAGTYEEAIDIFTRYKNYMLCLISDVKFYKNNILDENAGGQLVSHVRKELPNLPIIIQSYEQGKEEMANNLSAAFLNKNSEILMQEIKSFLSNFLGFGDFVFRDSLGNPLSIASSMEEFERALRVIPDDSLLYHSQKNHFSMWLAARGEIQVARIIHPSTIDDFSGPDEIREYLLITLKKYRQEKRRGKIVGFDTEWEVDESNIVSLAEGSFGGKGRGLSFINTLIYTFDVSQYTPNINLRTPRTSIIGTNEYECFMMRNSLYEKVFASTSYLQIQKHFLDADLSEQLKIRLDRLLQIYHRPLAVRSSGLLEDSIMQPFAGIFETYIIPNNHPDKHVRLKQAMDAIKLVYASVFSDTARGYIKAINYKIEDERMAVIVQEVVGNTFGNYYYPHISGVAQSYNYYPFGHIQPDDGFANIAVGLGKYVVEGERAYRFCPKYPTLINYSNTDLIKNSQVDFFAVDLTKHNINLLEGDEAGLARLNMYESEQHGTLKHCVSVFNPENNSLTPGLSQSGPRVVNFANILKYNYIPLAQSIQVVLDVVKEALGVACEIEFAVDLNRDTNYKSSFFLLQIKPMLGNTQDYKVDLDAIDMSKVILLSKNGMGNGYLNSVSDIVFIKREAFDKTMTCEMALELDSINSKLIALNRQCILIGPGRWGSRDRWIGIPVTWPQISQAKIIVETSFDDFPLDASYGSHFFHNVISMNVGYCSVQDGDLKAKIDWDVLNSYPVETETKFFKHIHLPKPLVVRMDGRQRLIVASIE
ncbi:MAG: pyruvate, phosphate dikinase [Bacteroidales bacterium]|nr:MAG: pyruvate, phosphate dikinase [Bacteroidales bacterium]